MPKYRRHLPKFYPSPSLVRSPMLALLDALEMANLIQITLSRTDTIIAADITTHVETTSMSGRDFLNLSPTELRTLSQNNEQIFQELVKLQQLPPSNAMAFLSTRRPLIEEGFPDLASLIHKRPAGSSAMLGPQIPEESLNHQAFDYGDAEDKLTQPTIAIVNAASPPLLPLLQAADLEVSIQQGHPDLLNLPQPDIPLASPNLGGETSILAKAKAVSDPANGSGLKNDTTITFLPNTHIRPATPDIYCSTRTHGMEDAHKADPQPIEDESMTPPITFYAGEASTHGLDELEPVNPLNSQSTNKLEASDSDPDLPAYCDSAPDTRSSSPASNPNTHDADMLLEHDGLPIITQHSCPTTEPPSPSTLEESQSESLPTLSLDHLQPLINTQTLITEDEEALDLPRSPSVSADTQNIAASTDETLEDSADEVISNLSVSDSSNPASREDDLDDMSIPTTTRGSTITLSMAMNTLPIIHVTPSNSPILEGLSKYMISYDSDTSGVVSQKNSAFDLDKSTSGEGQSLQSGCPQLSNPLESSSNESSSTPEPDVDTPIPPDPSCSQIQIRNSRLGVSNIGPSPYQRMQMGLLSVIPTFFALSRKTAYRAASGFI